MTEYLNTQNSHFVRKRGIAVPVQSIFTENGIYILDKGASRILISLGMQFGALGYIITQLIQKSKMSKKTKAQANLSYDEIVSADKNSYFFNYQQIEKYKLKAGFFSKWQGQKGIQFWVDNISHMLYLPNQEYDNAVSLLSNQCGGKLVN